MKRTQNGGGGQRRSAATRKPRAVDPEKLGAALAELPVDRAIELVEDALSLLQVGARDELLSRYVDLDSLREDAPGSLLGDVRAFATDVRAGRYHESFNVNSKNWTQTSSGTRRFIAECNRLLGRCVTASAGPSPRDTREAFEQIFALPRRIDEGDDDVFFADEAGSFQVGVAWESVLPAWIACLARTADPDAFGRLVAENVERHQGYQSTKHYAAARKVATAAQRKALLAHRRALRGRSR